MLTELNTDLAAQEKMIAQPFAKQEELDQKRLRFNEIMTELNPPEEQQMSEDEETQAQSRKYLENDKKRKYNKKRNYDETESLFMLFRDGSSEIGSTRKYFRYGKIRYYEKTVNGVVEISADQYLKNKGENLNENYIKANNQVNGIANNVGTSKTGNNGNISSNGNTGGTSFVYKQTIGEELRSDTGRSLSNVRGNNNGTSIISKSASMTEDRINYLIADSGAGMNTSYAQSWITSINPTDFLNLTLSEKAQDRNYFDSMPGDYGKNVNEYDYIEGLKKETRQTP